MPELRPRTKMRSARPHHTPRMGPTAPPCRLLPLLACLLLLCLPATLRAELTQDLRQLIEDASIGNGRVGISIVDLHTGRSLASIDADSPYIPASNMKLLTSGAALAVLGPDFVFRTELRRDGHRLVVLGDGDPALADPLVLNASHPSMTVDDLLDVLTDAVIRADIERISELVVDDRVFDRDFVHDGWPSDQLDRHYAAQVAGLNFHNNVLAFYPAPSPDGPGNPAVFTTQPEAPWFEIGVRARTVNSGSNSAWVMRHLTRNEFTLRGEIRMPSQVPVRVALHDSPLFMGHLLADRLARAELPVGTGEPDPAAAISAVRLAEEDENIANDRTLAVITTPINEILRRCNADSQNLYAEALIKRMGHAVTREPGSWSNGASVLRMVLSERLGPEAAARTAISDGSGLSRGNGITPNDMTAWLASFHNDETLRPHFLDSLPQPGQGTLRRRFPNGQPGHVVHAKSGSIRGVRCLSGYITHKDTGRTIAFAVLVNDLSGAGNHNIGALRLHEAVVDHLDSWLDANPAREGATAGARN